MSTSKPSITKAFNETVYPEMEQDGFIKLNSKHFARIIDKDVLQWISLHVKTGIKREYLIEYGSQLLCKPSDVETKTIGGRFTKLSSGGTYGAKSDLMLSRSIPRALLAYTEEVRPALSSADNVEKLIQKYSALSELSPNIFNTGHPSFSIGCAQASKGQVENSLHYCNQAKELYSLKDAAWSPAGINNCERLINAINNNSYESLLSEWRNFTVNSIGLEKCIT